MSKPRVVLTLGLFVAGIVLGAAAYFVTAAPPASGAVAPSNPYPSLRQVAEPSVAARLAQAVRTDDAVALAFLLQSQENLKRLRSAISPIAAITDIQFVGATQGSGGETISAYVVRGRDRTGTKLVRGFVVNVVRDEVIGVNR